METSNDKIYEFLNWAKENKLQIIREKELLDFITSTLEHTCETCADQIVCFANDTFSKENCDYWHADFMEIQNRIERIKITLAALKTEKEQQEQK